jgi:hypothetical protein
MSLSGFFEHLGAPLNNIRWSWGSQRARDGAVFLRVWSDHQRREGDGRRYMMLDSSTPGPDRVRTNNLGYEERLHHIEAIRAGALSYMIVCDPNEPYGVPKRTIRNFDERTLLVGGPVVQIEGKTFIEVIGTKEPNDVAGLPSGPAVPRLLSRPTSVHG